MHVPLFFLDLRKTDLRGFPSRGRILKGVPFPFAAGPVIVGAISSVFLSFVSPSSVPERSEIDGRALPRKEVHVALFSGFRSVELRSDSAWGCRPAGKPWLWSRTGRAYILIYYQCPPCSGKGTCLVIDSLKREVPGDAFGTLGCQCPGCGRGVCFVSPFPGV